ncbi:unnamed protein product [Ilex paraguariensis]|uniref:Uncharacterized protein n=1 Tax=Ilex paraguariensis TaxID=185542 RepID=A0ABC8RDI3_9AQUA
MWSVYVHDLTVHYLADEFVVKNIDPDVYCYFDMLNDVCEIALKDVPSNVNTSISLSCGIHGSMQKMHVNEDADVVKMFQLNNKSTVIHVYIDGVQFIPPLIEEASHPPPPTNKRSTAKEKEVEDGNEDEALSYSDEYGWCVDIESDVSLSCVELVETESESDVSQMFGLEAMMTKRREKKKDGSSSTGAAEIVAQGGSEANVPTESEYAMF